MTGESRIRRYDMSYHGLEALQVGFLVAFTQLIPEHQVQMFGGVVKARVKVRELPFSVNDVTGY
jgi:hypothetical protein